MKIGLGLSLITLLILSFSLTVSAQESDPPQYIYLTAKSDPTHTMGVNWRTDDNYIGEVRYDTDPQNGNPEDYSFTQEGPGADTTNEFEGYIHHVDVEGLKPDTLYHFIVGSEERGWSDEYSFRTAPVDDKHIRFVQGGDSRSEQRADATHYPWPGLRDNVSKLMASYNPDFVIFTGDYLWDGESQDGEDTWDNWLGAMFKYWRKNGNQLIPILPGIGNHEIHPYPPPPVYDRYKDAGNFYMIFDLPENEDRYAWYSVNWGPDIHITILDTLVRNSLSEAGKKQTQWLQQDLQKHEEDLWKFAASHDSPTPAFGDVLFQSWTSEFDIYHLDIMFSGDIHRYERTYPLNLTGLETKGWNDSLITETENGTVYVISAGWGELPEEHASHWYSAAGPVAKRNFALVDIYENGMLRLRGISIDNEVLDDYTIQKQVEIEEESESPISITVASVVIVVVIVLVAGIFLFRRR